MHRTHHHARRWLPGLHFFLADVRDGLGPFLGVFLLAQGWRLDDIGYVMALGGITGMLATTPLGALVDASRRKRRLLAAAIALLLAGNLAIWIAPSLAVTAASQVITGVVAALIAPACWASRCRSPAMRTCPGNWASTKPGTTPATWPRPHWRGHGPALGTAFRLRAHGLDGLRLAGLPGADAAG